MNAILGARIRALRESKGLTQEHVAEEMNCTRQKYARIEKGLIDISYASIVTIAAVLGVESREITSATDNNENQPLFRKDTMINNDDKFEYISEMINNFYAHKKIYNSVKQVDVNE